MLKENFKLLFFIVFIIIVPSSMSAQPALYTANWQDAGMKATRPMWSNSVNILSYGGDASGLIPNDIAWTAAITALGGKPGTVFFPPGKYLFAENINIARDSIILKGAGYNKTTLIFDMARVAKNCLQIAGTVLPADTAYLSTSATRYQNKLSVINAAKFKAGDWLLLGMDDKSYFFSSWAYGLLTQTMQVSSVSGSEINFLSPIRFNYPLSKKPFIKRILPRQMVGIECLKIKRLDDVAAQTSLVNFDKAVNCWVEGVETDSGNFAHIALSQCSNIEVLNSYIHHAFGYGGGGEGYGVVLQGGTGECRIEGNNFVHLRHSILLQSATNGNVISYNYSKDPYWTGTLLPANSAGDMVLHGNLPYLNLFEGNINQNTVIDDSHGANGVFNTFFRNRSEGFGILMNSAPYTDSTQIVGHEITNPILGLYSVGGSGLLTYSNNVNGTIKPTSTLTLSKSSLYLPSGAKPYCNDAYPVFPAIAYPNLFNKGNNQAKDRFLKGVMAVCSCDELTLRIQETNSISHIYCYPNPFTKEVNIQSNSALQSNLYVYNILGQMVYSTSFLQNTIINTEHWASGMYFLKIDGSISFKLAK